MANVNPFLKQLAAWLLTKGGSDLSDYHVVFPNKRASLYFRQYLSELSATPLWSPRMYDITSFISSFSSCHIAASYDLIFELYEIYIPLATSKGQSVEEIDAFYPWGSMIIQDFDEIDRQLVVAADIFRMIAAVKDTDNVLQYLEEHQLNIIRQFWYNISSSVVSEHKEKFLRTWEMLPELYTSFQEKLHKLNKVYEGMIYREVAEKAKEGMLHPAGMNIVFAGFNYLSKAEEEIFHYFKKYHNASFFWDGEDKFLLKEDFPVFRNIRKNKQKFPPPDNFILQQSNDFSKPEITLTGVPLEAGQVKMVGDDLSKLSLRDLKSDDIAVVLPAEHMLLPMLYSLPTDTTVNITMGLPLKSTYIAAFVQTVTELWQGAHRRNNNESVFLSKSMLKLLMHPLVLSSFPEEVKALNRLLHNTNASYIRQKSLEEYKGIYGLMFDHAGQDFDLLSYLLELTKKSWLLLDAKKEKSIEKEFLYGFYKELNKLNESIIRKRIKAGDMLVAKLLNEIINAVKLPFSGEPLSGMQLLGTLETRCLDFDRIFILSLNEGIWPANSMNRSFIPYNLRKAFDMPTFEMDDQVYAYYFYRLLQRSNHVHLLYNTETGQNATGEVSRYITQMKYDLGLAINEQVLVQDVKTFQINDLGVDKEDKVMEMLESIFAVGDNPKLLSASALNTYLDCSLKFYFQYLAKLPEAEELETELESRQIGNILHELMERFYKNIIDSKKSALINSADILNNLHLTASLLEKVLQSQFESKDAKNMEEGINLLIGKVIENYATTILQFDAKNCPFEIVSLESWGGWLTCPVDMELNGKKKCIHLGGKIDRLDLHKNVLRIIDYKSGREEMKFRDIESLFDTTLEKRNKAVFQMFFYSLLAEMNYPEKAAIQPALYIINSMFAEDYQWKLSFNKGSREYIPIEDIRPMLAEYRELLIQLIQEIFNRNKGFRQTENKKRCEYCPYNKMCGR